MFGHATGSYGHVHDYHHFSTYDSIKSLPVLLSNAGYETARIGKYHVAPEKVYHFNQVLEADPRNTVEMAQQCDDVLKSDKPIFLYLGTDDNSITLLELIKYHNIKISNTLAEVSIRNFRQVTQ